MGDAKAWWGKVQSSLLCNFRVNRKLQHYQKLHKMCIFNIFEDELWLFAACLCCNIEGKRQILVLSMCTLHTSRKRQERDPRGRCKLWSKGCTGNSPNPVLAVAAALSLPAMDRAYSSSSLLPFFSVILQGSSPGSVLVQSLLQKSCQMCGAGKKRVFLCNREGIECYVWVSLCVSGAQCGLCAVQGKPEQYWQPCGQGHLYLKESPRRREMKQKVMRCLNLLRKLAIWQAKLLNMHHKSMKYLLWRVGFHQPVLHSSWEGGGLLALKWVFVMGFIPPAHSPV